MNTHGEPLLMTSIPGRRLTFSYSMNNIHSQVTADDLFAEV